MDDGREINFDVYKQATISTKFDLIFDQVNTMLEKSPELKTLYDNFIDEFDKEPTINIARKYIPDIFKIVDELGNTLGYHEFTYTPPTYKNDLKTHINESDYGYIMMSSLRSKFICAQCTFLREHHMNVVKYIYGEVMKELYTNGILFKLEKVVDSTVIYASSSGMDHKSQLWVVFSSGKGIDPQNIALRERNNVFYKGFPTIAPGKDPIKWLISIVRTSIKFLMKDKITQVNIAVNNPVETVDSSNNKLLKMFIYENVISNRKLFKLVAEMPFSSVLMSEYVLPITHTITTPFISIVFDTPNLNINRLPNLILLNLLTYKFMGTAEVDWKIFELLTCKAVPKIKSYKGNEDPFIDVYDDYIRTDLAHKVKKQIKQLNFDKYSTYTSKQLEDVFKDTIKQIYHYDYIDYKGDKLSIHPEIIANEYISYIFNLSVGKYKNQIEGAKRYIMATEDAIENAQEEE